MILLFIKYFLKAVDQDRSGKISAAELQQALMNNKMKQFNHETCRLMIGMFDKNRCTKQDFNFSLLEFKYLLNSAWLFCFLFSL